jgi:uncharacterized membrane protein
LDCELEQNRQFAKLIQVSPWPVPVWFVFASMFAGLLLFMVLFVETEVCEYVNPTHHNKFVYNSD